MSTCPTCHQSAPETGAACLHCGSVPPVRAPSGSSLAGPASAGVPDTEFVAVPVYTASREEGDRKASRYSDVQPEWQFIALQLSTLGFYSLFWFYSGWDLVRQRRRLWLSPAGRALFPMFFIRSFCKEIFQLAEPAGFVWSRWQPLQIASGWLLLSVAAHIVGRADSTPLILLSLGLDVASFWVLLPVVRALNTLWRHEQPDRPERRMLTPGALAVVVIGGLFWLLGITVLFMPEL